MKALAVIINIFLPGVGTLIIGKIGQGIAQIIFYLVGVMLILTGIGFIIGWPLCVGIWIWAIVAAATSPNQPIQVIVRNETGRPLG